MQAAEARRAVTAAISVAASLDLAVDDAVVLSDSNRMVARLLPCDIVARVSPVGWFSAAREVELARRLAEETDAPVAGLDPRVEPGVHERDGFEIAMWSYFEPADLRESIGEVQRAHIDSTQGAMETLQLVRIVGG